MTDPVPCVIDSNSREFASFERVELRNIWAWLVAPCSLPSNPPHQHSDRDRSISASHKRSIRSHARQIPRTHPETRGPSPKTLSRSLDPDIPFHPRFWDNGPMRVGYARVSRKDQRLEPQRDALLADGYERISEEEISSREVAR